MDVEGTIECLVMTASGAEIRVHGFCCQKVKNSVSLMPLTGKVHYGQRLDKAVSPHLCSPATTSLASIVSMRLVNDLTCTTSRSNSSTGILRVWTFWGYFFPFNILSTLPNIPDGISIMVLLAIMLSVAWIKFISMCRPPRTGITDLK